MHITLFCGSLSRSRPSFHYSHSESVGRHSYKPRPPRFNSNLRSIGTLGDYEEDVRASAQARISEAPRSQRCGRWHSVFVDWTVCAGRSKNALGFFFWQCDRRLDRRCCYGDCDEIILRDRLSREQDTQVSSSKPTTGRPSGSFSNDLSGPHWSGLDIHLCQDGFRSKVGTSDRKYRIRVDTALWARPADEKIDGG